MFVFRITLNPRLVDEVPGMTLIPKCPGRVAAPLREHSAGARSTSIRLVVKLLWICSLTAALACGGGGGGGGGSDPSGGGSNTPPSGGGSGGGSNTPPASTPPPPTPPPPTPTAMQNITVRLLPSASAGILGYRLSVATASGRYGSATQINIPLSALQDGGAGVLEYAAQVPRDSISYLALRAYSASAFSAYSNEVVVSAASSSASTSSAVGVGESDGGAPPAPSAPVQGSASPSSGFASASPANQDSSTGESSADEVTDSSVGASESTMTSLDFDGAGEYLASSSALMLGVSTQFTLSVWALADPQASGIRTLVSVRGGGETTTENRVELSSDAGDLLMSVYNASGQLVYEAIYSSALVGGEWRHVALTFNAQVDAAPLLFANGSVRAPDLAELTGHPPTFSDSAGRIVVGSDGSGTLTTWRGAIGHIGLWNVALGDDEIDEIALRGHTLDLRENAGAYQGMDALLHYWRLGEDVNAVGLDSGSATVPIDLDDPAGGVDASDVVLDAPALVQ